MGEKMQFTELDQYLFGQGTHYDIYKKLGAHPTTQHRKKGVYFAVWAPNARYERNIGMNIEDFSFHHSLSFVEIFVESM